MKPKTNGRDIEVLMKRAEMLNRRVEELVIELIRANEAMNQTIADYKKCIVITES